MHQYYKPNQLDNSDKELIILVNYVGVIGLAQSRARELLASRGNQFKDMTDEWSKQTKYLIKSTTIPTLEGSKIECIFPVSKDINNLDDIIKNDSDDTNTLQKFE